jgi:hypothetical protein
MPKPKSIGSPVLESVRPVIAASRHVRTDAGQIEAVAGWLAWEELPFPEFVLPFGMGADPDEAMDFILVSTLLNFAFTDFRTGVKFTAAHGGRMWSDSEGLFACMKRALEKGLPFLRGEYLRTVTRRDLQQIFRGNLELPLLDERVEILRAAGETLTAQYGGRYCNFVRAGRPRAFDRGRGLVERLVAEFPRFRDISRYGRHVVKLYKLAQLGAWMLHACLSRSGAFALEDARRLTAFADYIVPVALRVLGIQHYSPALERAIHKGRLVPRDSAEEVEIRAHTIYAVALLTEAVNRRRPRGRQVLNAQVDARLWTHYHATFQRHHLTKTIMY